ncbi:MAG: SpoIIE family protein phosphatase [Salinivirgaceae bacterium]|jgi:PAS domain S-box-containing protein|nr:SpoIIE family protein phosphatase [Salinivirgaceae bacterium]
MIRVWLAILFLCMGMDLLSQDTLPAAMKFRILPVVEPARIPVGQPDSIPFKGPVILRTDPTAKHPTPAQTTSFAEANIQVPEVYSLQAADTLIIPDSMLVKQRVSMEILDGELFDKEAHRKMANNVRKVEALQPRFKDNAVVDIKYFDVEQGLSNSYIYDIHQDKGGFIWAATNGGGVCRFDGAHFEVYNENSGLADDIVLAIDTDESDNLWFGTHKGLSFFNRFGFLNFTIEDGLSSNYISDVLVARNGIVWVATNDGGLNLFDGEQFVVWDEAVGMGNFVTSLYEDYSGRIWIGTHRNGLYVFDQNKLYHRTKSEGLLSNRVLDIDGNKQGDVAIAYDKGLDIQTDSTLIRYTVAQGLPDPNIKKVYFDNDNDLMLGTDVGFVRIAKDGVTYLNTNHGLSTNQILAILKDDSGVYWLGTWGGGLNKYDGYSFLHLGKEQGLPSNIVPAMAMCAEGRVWFGTYDDGFFFHENAKVVHYHKPQGFSESVVWSMLFDRYNDLWFATGGEGLWKFDGEYFSVYETGGGLPDDHYWSLLAARNGVLWIGTAKSGILKFDGQRFYQLPLTESIILSLYEDSKGNIWATTWGDGIYKISYNNIIHYHNTTNFWAHRVTNVFEDSDGYLWFSTNGEGIFVYNGSTFEVLDRKMALPTNIIYWIRSHSSGSVFIGSENGLTQLKPLTASEPSYPEKDFLEVTKDSITAETTIRIDGREYAVINYGIEDGFTGSDCVGTQFSSIEGKRGAMWIATGKHLTAFNPNNRIADTTSPVMHIKDINISLQSFNWEEVEHELANRGKSETGVYFDRLVGDYHIPDGLVLSHYQNHITFQYLGIEWKKPHDTRYRYRLLGYETEWNFPTKNTIATYSNLSPGEYTFQVKAENSDHVWSDPVSYSFRIKTPWWQTIFFQLAALLFIIGGVYGFIRWRIGRLKQQKDTLETMVRDRTREILTQKEEIQSQRDYLNKVNLQLERLSIVASETQNGVLIADSRGNIEWINEGYTNLLGYTLRELIDTKGPNLFFIYRNENTLDFLQQCRDRKKPVTFSSIFERNDGEQIWLQATLTPIVGDHDSVTKYVVIYADISSLKNAQNQIEKHNREITASIRYASRIQSSMLLLQEEIKGQYIDSFVIYKPRDPVGGDFYWYSEYGDNFLIGVIDCTGHGVPGALMTVISYAALTKLINDDTAKNPAALLQLLNKEIRKMLRQQGNHDGASDDGLDASFCYVNAARRTMQFSGAMQSLLYTTDEEIIQIKGDRQSIGYISSVEDYKYTSHEVDLAGKQCFYLASDGYKDMAVGKDGYILGKRRLREIIYSLRGKSLSEQHRSLQELMNDAINKNGQLDDITMIGFRVKV